MSEASESICITPLTPTYSTLPRFNTTVLLLFVLISPTSSWATKGALAALMARVATISIHSIVLLATKVLSRPLDLDIIGSWFLLSEVSVAVPLMLSWAPALQKSKAGFLIRIWGILVFVGAICGFVAVSWAQTYVDNRTCPASNTETGQHAPLVFQKDDIFSKLARNTLLGRFDSAAVAAATYGLWICVRPESWSQSSSKKGPQRLIWLLELAGLCFASVVLIATIVLHERYMLAKPQVPMLLPATAYEQWNGWAATGIVVAATLVNWLFGKEETRATRAATRAATQPSTSDQTKLYSKAKTDLEWAGVLGQPTPSHIR